MTRTDRRALERKLEQTRRLALEPTDPLTRERLAQMIEEIMDMRGLHRPARLVPDFAV